MHQNISKVRDFVIRWFRRLWQFFVGGIAVLVAFSSNFIDFKRPHVTAEITGIEQITTTAVDVTISPELVSLRKLLLGDSLSFIGGRQLKYTTDEMRQAIDRQKQSLNDRKQELLKLKDQLDVLRSKEPQKNIGNKKEASFNFLFKRDVSEMNYDDAKKTVSDFDKSTSEFEGSIKAAEAEVKNYIDRMERSEAKIVVTAAISNSGDGATTLKPQALLRTDLGQGNYLDINLRIANYEGGSAEIKARGTSVLKFESQPINKMAPADQERFLNFFKNTSPTNLFISDVRGTYYRSNTIPFAQGIYEQKIYDGLKTYASEHTR